MTGRSVATSWHRASWGLMPLLSSHAACHAKVAKVSYQSLVMYHL